MAVRAFVAAVAVVTLLAGTASASLPMFFRGRPQGGMVNFPIRSRLGTVDTSSVETKWAVQMVDNFDPQNTQTFKARYFVNTQYWQTGGPVFFMLGGESAQDPIWAVESNMVENAKTLGALIVLGEHRFYGKSQPFSDLSTENLRFLSSEQALADYANLVDVVRAEYDVPAASPVIAFGGSYSGALAAWLRLKYPSKVIASVATSSPVHAQLDFVQYLQVVTASLQNAVVDGSSQCTDNIATAVKAMAAQLATTAGRTKVSQMFNTCTSLVNDTPNDLNVMNFMSNTIGLFMGVVQYNLDNRAFEGATNTNVTVEVLCDMMTQKGTEPLTQWAAINTLLNGDSCVEVNYTAMIEALRATALTAPAAEGGRQWTYQTCAEFGFYQTTDGDNQVFGSSLPLSFSIQQCEDIFGSEFSQAFIQGRVNFTLAHYGGYDLLGTNILVPNGNIDPWHKLSVLTPNPAYNISTILINGGAHCSNMYPNRPSDSTAVRDARAHILTQLTDWVGA